MHRRHTIREGLNDDSAFKSYRTSWPVYYSVITIPSFAHLLSSWVSGHLSAPVMPVLSVSSNLTHPSFRLHTQELKGRLDNSLQMTFVGDG